MCKREGISCTHLSPGLFHDLFFFVSVCVCNIFALIVAWFIWNMHISFNTSNQQKCGSCCNVNLVFDSAKVSWRGKDEKVLHSNFLQFQPIFVPVQGCRNVQMISQAEQLSGEEALMCWYSFFYEASELWGWRKKKLIADCIIQKTMNCKMRCLWW